MSKDFKDTISQKELTRSPDYSLISDFLNVFSKGIKTSLIYPADNPIPLEFKNSCWEKLNKYLDDYYEMEFDLSSDSFKAKEKVLFKAPSREENLAGVMYRDGIRRLKFHQGLTESEWYEFFDAILTVMKNKDGFDDLVNLFWQKDMPHIEYDAVDDFSLAEISQDFQHSSKQDVVYSDVVLAESQVQSSSALEALNPNPDSSQNACETQLIEIDSIFKDIHKFSGEEEAYIDKLLNHDNELIIEFEAIDLVFEIMGNENELSNFDESLRTITVMFNKMLENEQFSLLVYLIKRMKEYHQIIKENSATRAEKLFDCLMRTGDRIRITKITNMLNESQDMDLDGIRLYLEELDWESLPSLIWMLGELKYFPARKMIIQALVNKGRERIDIIGNAAFDSRWYVIRNAVLIIGEIGQVKGLSYLKKPLEHSDERVRWETVAAIEKIDAEKGYRMLLPLLYDESDRIRHKVIDLFTEVSCPEAFEAFKELMNTRAYSDLEHTEQRQIIYALAQSGGEDAQDILKKILKKWSLFSSEKLEYQKESALRAMARIDTENAWNLIKSVADKKKGKLSEIASILYEKEYQDKVK